MSRQRKPPTVSDFYEDLLLSDELDLDDLPEIDIVVETGDLEPLSSQDNFIEVPTPPRPNYVVLQARSYGRERTREMPKNDLDKLHELSKPLSENLPAPQALKTGNNPTIEIEQLIDTLKTPPPTPAVLIHREVERRAPAVHWRVLGGRSVHGQLMVPVTFDVKIEVLLLHPLCIHMEVHLETLVLTSDGEFEDAWQDIRHQLNRLHRDSSLACFFLNRA